MSARDVEAVLAEALEAHLPRYESSGDYGEMQWVECSCDSEYFVDTDAGETEHRAHVAAEQAAALGALPTGETREEWGHRYPDGSVIAGSSETVARSLSAISRVRGANPLVLMRRTVTPWVEVPAAEDQAEGGEGRG